MVMFDSDVYRYSNKVSEIMNKDFNNKSDK